MQISVLIPTYNDGPLLSETLAPLLRDEATGEVVVVVDGSRDGSLELLLEIARNDDRVRPFWIENRGRAGARQFGLERVRYDVLLLLDADVVAGERLVSGHARHHADGRDRLVVGYMPPVVGPRRPGSFVVERYAHQYELAARSYEHDPSEILRRLWMGNVSVSRRALLAAGGCDAGAGIRYGEDMEMGLRLAAAEVEVEPVFDRTLLAEHRFEQTVGGFVQTSRIFGEDLVTLERLHPGQARFPVWRKRGVGAAVARFATRRRGYRALRVVTLLSLTVAGRLHLWPVERRVAALLDRLEVQRGIQIGLAAGASAPAAGRG
ncbi:MAG: glycosyltransferase [Solirubrobacterales bacterium]|nr:glycosyltransferase [Solirubrobacterales bacterium]